MRIAMANDCGFDGVSAHQIMAPCPKDHPIVVPAERTARIHEPHGVLLHLLAEIADMATAAATTVPVAPRGQAPVGVLAEAMRP